MTKSVSNSEKPRKQYTPEFRNEALKLAERIDDLPEYNIKTIAASLRHQGLLAKASRKRSPVSYCAHGLPLSENLLKWDFTVDAAIPLWLCRRCGRCPGCCRSFRKDKSGHERINVRGSQRWPYCGASYRQNGRRTVCKTGATALTASHEQFVSLRSVMRFEQWNGKPYFVLTAFPKA